MRELYLARYYASLDLPDGELLKHLSELHRSAKFGPTRRQLRGMILTVLKRLSPSGGSIRV